MKQFAQLIFVLLSCCPVAFAQDTPAPTYRVKAIEGIVFQKVAGEEIKLNLFLPVKEDGSMLKGTPLLIHIGGGCMIIAGPGNGGYWSRWNMVQKGYAVASIAHRSLNRGHLLPAQYEDVRAAVRFLRKNAARYGYDARRFAALGASSAGVLATVTGISDKHRLFDTGENLDQSSQVQCVVAFCSTPDFECMIAHQDGKVLPCIAQSLGAKAPEGLDNAALAQFDFSPQVKKLIDKARAFSVVNYVDADYAPTIILHGFQDTAVPMSQACLLHEALRRAGVKTELCLYPAGRHSPQTYGPDDKIRKPVLRFLEETLGPPSPSKP